MSRCNYAKDNQGSPAILCCDKLNAGTCAKLKMLWITHAVVYVLPYDSCCGVAMVTYIRCVVVCRVSLKLLMFQTI